MKRFGQALHVMYILLCVFQILCRGTTMTTMDLHLAIRIYHWKKCRHQYMNLQLNKCCYYVNVRTVLNVKLHLLLFVTHLSLHANIIFCMFSQYVDKITLSINKCIYSLRHETNLFRMFQSNCWS